MFPILKNNIEHWKFIYNTFTLKSIRQIIKTQNKKKTAIIRFRRFPAIRPSLPSRPFPTNNNYTSLRNTLSTLWHWHSCQAERFRDYLFTTLSLKHGCLDSGDSSCIFFLFRLFWPCLNILFCPLVTKDFTFLPPTLSLPLLVTKNSMFQLLRLSFLFFFFSVSFKSKSDDSSADDGKQHFCTDVNLDLCLSFAMKTMAMHAEIWPSAQELLHNGKRDRK